MNDNKKCGVFLINLGTPQSPSIKDVWRYLAEFLTDKRVIDLPWLQRQFLVRGVIIPTRVRQSAKSYQAIWTKEGSPLMVHSLNVKKKLQNFLGENFFVTLGMRYQTPSLTAGLQELFSLPIDHLVILPLFPQYASATTGSVHQKVMEIIKSERSFPKITFIDNFADHPGFIKALAVKAKKFLLSSYDHILFSFHGLPKKQLIASDKHCHCLVAKNCCLSPKGCCYSAQCYATANALAKELNINNENFTICFQSRLGKDPWITPYTSNILLERAQKGDKRLLVFCPSFVCDCLETIHEIAVEYQEEFLAHGGEQLDLVEGLNDDDCWVEALGQLIHDHI